ncbi:hypothetical protein EYC80_005723 [Monilinia laxa]|uniref:Yeast cell wall synthesis Kre9/Knh1-like N-terminal domain-containing protein n=1 Tax=Monilinia laxa TaxID=61186 RepID=A0A5N6KEX1_MONLA|nr:hypothetical protein EYC80_005723 [Monilinia laxa]
MRYQFISAAILASMSSVLAQTPGFDAISVPTKDQIVKVGGVMDIKWAPNAVAGTVTIKLLEGANPQSLNYDPVVIASHVNNLDGLYKWTIPASVGSFETYGIAIFLDSDVNTFQWSFPFKIQAADKDTTSVVVSTTAPSSAPSTTSAPITSIPASYVSTSTATSSFSSISGIPGGCNPAHPGSCPSSYFSTSTTVAPAAVPTGYVAPNGTSNGTYTAPGTNSTKTGSGVVQATGAAAANVATGSFALLGGLFAAFVLNISVCIGRHNHLHQVHLSGLIKTQRTYTTHRAALHSDTFIGFGLVRI